LKFFEFLFFLLFCIAVFWTLAVPLYAYRSQTTVSLQIRLPLLPKQENNDNMEYKKGEGSHRATLSIFCAIGNKILFIGKISLKNLRKSA
jgi:hypothetical protein